MPETTMMDAGAPPLPMRRFSVEDYHRMIEADVLGEDDAVELLEGWIVEKMSKGPAHESAVDRCQEALRRRLPEGFRVRVQSAITTRDSEPEPDLAVVPGPASRYDRRHPGPEDIVLVVEVADASLARDRLYKARLYARAGVSVYWIINLREGVVEAHSEPTSLGEGAPRYRTRCVHSIEDELPLVLGGRQVARVPVRELLPAAQ